MKFLYTIIFLSFYTAGWATHNRAGEIVYKHMSGLTYEFTVTTFTYSLSPADRDELGISWGDNSISNMLRKSKTPLPDNYNKNVYVIQHTFPGSGVYTIVVEDPNRNLGVVNIPNSVSVVFSIRTVFKIDPSLGANNAPQLLTYPIDKAAVGQIFIHNPSAFDPDGDSLSYELTPCTREKGAEIENYTLPEASESLTVDPVTGDLTWTTPVKAGIYNVAMKINEWRKGVRLSSISRDMQVDVIETNNRPPVNPPLPPRCVEAGTLIDMVLTSTDPDNDQLIQTATGGPFQVTNSPASFNKIEDGPGFSTSGFLWQTNYTHVRKQPYTMVLKSEDQNTEVKLVDFDNLNITVLAPRINNLEAVAGNKTILLSWAATPCQHAEGYEIYRSVGKNPVNPDSCYAGIPAGSGYEKVGSVQGVSNTSFEDNNNGKGLSPGIEYCYRIVAYFADDARSFPSDESCALLLSGNPPIIKASVEVVDQAVGENSVMWLKSAFADKLAGKPGPFQYRLYRSTDQLDWTLLYQTNPPNSSIEDTTFVDKNINTLSVLPYYYKVELWNMENGNEYQVEDNETASTLVPDLQPSDQSVIINFARYAPWLNTGYEIYRCQPSMGTCDPAQYTYLAVTNSEPYIDKELQNGEEYCYRVLSRGYRSIDGRLYENTNWSHIACTKPFDNVSPCPPDATGHSLCAENKNRLEWTIDPACSKDVVKYYIYFSSGRNNTFEVIDSVFGVGANFYDHSGVLVGCYQVTAVDDAGNESLPGAAICLDECGLYELPNVFTPDGDNINDIFKSYNPGGIVKVDMKIYNRWGRLVFKTENPDINWDGRDVTNKNFVQSGVYYYTCDVYEDRLTGTRINTLSGTINLYSGKDAKPFNE